MEFSICNDIALNIFNLSSSYVFGTSIEGNVMIVLSADVLDLVTRGSSLPGVLASFVEECALKTSDVECGLIGLDCLLLQTKGY